MTTKPIRPVALGKQVVDLIQARLQDEYNAFYAYRNAYLQCLNWNYPLAASFFKDESEDELVHARLIEEYIVSWNLKPVLPLPAPEAVGMAFIDLVDVVNKAYAMELDLLQKYETTSSQVLELDKVSFDFLSKFRTIQLESVQGYSDLLNALALVNTSNPLDLLQFERYFFGQESKG